MHPLQTPPAPTSAPRSSEPDELIRALEDLRADMLAAEADGLARAHNLHPVYLASARNLLHYLALRRRDLRGLQQRLAHLGLSSLGRCEAAVLATVDAVLCALRGLTGRGQAWDRPPSAGLSLSEGQGLLERHAQVLLGPPRERRRVRILVTLPSEAAHDAGLVERLLAEGMDCARINCAHDDPAAWERMVQNLRRAEVAVGRPCRILMDLGGPKLRTGPVRPGPAVRKLRPERDALGRVTSPARVRLVPAGAGTTPTDLAIAPTLFRRLVAGDVLHLVDSRGARRRLRVAAVDASGAQALLEQTTYLTPGLALRLRRDGVLVAEGAVAPFAGPPGRLRLRRGDALAVTRTLEPGRDAVLDAAGRPVAPAQIGCTLPEVFAQVRPGEPIWFDDGRIGGVVREVDPERLLVEVTQADEQGSRLAADKGINLPGSDLRLQALTAKDIEDLPHVVRHADAVALSFVTRAQDVDLLEEHLRRLGRPELGIVLKIETVHAFERLPELLLASMQSPCDGVMIARGDLAVECGWERLAEVQEEILWLCEAAHIPVIWATQVLETLAKEGRATRAEITDAAMGERAECVMLNKGPHLPLAVRTLDDILARMQHHQQKKRAMLRPLKVALGGTPPVG